MTKLIKIITMGILLGSLISNLPEAVAQKTTGGDFKVEYEKYQLDNGLQVVLHHDASNPIVSVAILYHVGSSREKVGKTGFAHFFEHMLFQNSENVGKGMFFKKIDDLGGSFNGGTWNDGTVYYEVVPKDALEKILWMESDRMGFLINTVTQGALDREKDIVINEKRQRVDNQPYGHADYVLDKNLYPASHPYSWQVIGSMDDLRSATLEDVKEFYDKYYCVNNATMVIAGDFDAATVKKLVNKYFSEFKPRTKPAEMKPMPVALNETKKLYHEDNFAKLPELTIVIPTVETYHPDSYALDVLADLLAEGKKAPLYKEIVENRKLAPSISVYNQTLELAGKFNISVKAFENTSLDSVMDAIHEGFMQFEKNGFSESDLQRIKNIRETSFYNSISSLLGKSFQLVQANVFGGDPGRMMDDVKLLNAVTKEDVMRVYDKYIRNRNFVVTSFVPKGQANLVLTGSVKADVVEESIEDSGSESTETAEATEQFERTPSTFDRTIEPGLGEKPLLTTPQIFDATLKNQMHVYGIESHELPLVQFSIRLKGGQLLEQPEKVGVSRLLADLMMEGTKDMTPEELEEAIGQLGAKVNITSSAEFITITGNCLSRNYNALLALVEKIILEPRWDVKEFDRLKQAALSNIIQRQANPNAIAGNVFYKKLYGDNHILSLPGSGTVQSVQDITIDDLKDYYNKAFSSSVASFHIAGDIPKDAALASLKNLEKNWAMKKVVFPEYTLPANPAKPAVYFVDVPDAKQSVIMIGSLTVPRNNPDYFPASFTNYKLGDGSGSKLFQVLRLEKGYTYGAYSFLIPRITAGPFIANSSVQSMFTLESLILFHQIISDYGKEYTSEDLETTRSAMIRSNAGKFETIGNLIGMLHDISTFDLSHDYIKQEEQAAEQLTLEQAKSIYSKYIRPENMVYVIVGDARTQFSRIKEAGLGDPVMLDKEGNEIKL
ncbi:MAG TPA: pitrilysin family protein [Lentimicrobium sp.]|nr:pitrilysin family protein [Lentimicrobium sp.]